MNAALFATIWAALAAFVVAEAGRRPGSLGHLPAPWSRPVSFAGLALLVVHIALAYGIRHDWSHDAAVRATAQQTAAVYGLDWGGGIYVNFLFAMAWAVDVWLRPPAIHWALRLLYLVIIVNAAVIFVPGPRRWLGVVLVLALIWIWRPRSSA